MLKKMRNNGTSKRSRNDLSYRKMFIILISSISIFLLLIMNVQYLDFNTNPSAYINAS